MTNLNLDIFKPWEPKLLSLVDLYKDLTIKDLDDNEGYDEVKAAIKDCTTHRTSIVADGKALRSEALLFQKTVIAREKELLSITSVLEEKLKNEKSHIDEERILRDRMELLPSRKLDLSEIDIIIDDKELLLMSPEQYREFYNNKKLQYLESKEAKIKEEQEEIDKQKALDNAKKEGIKEAKKYFKQEAKERVDLVLKLLDDFLIEYDKNKEEPSALNLLKIQFISNIKKLLNV